MKNGNVFHFHTHATGRADEMLAVLAQAGYSNTRARRAVLVALQESGGQASPAELLAFGRAYHPALGLVTVYRTLEILHGLGLVRKLHLEDGCHTYALSLIGAQGEVRGGDRLPHGHHVICRDCGRAVEFEGCDLGAVVASVEAQTGFRVHEHWLELFGMCPDCQGANASQRPGNAERRGYEDIRTRKTGAPPMSASAGQNKISNQEGAFNEN